MSALEFTYWKAAYRIQPWGERLDDVHFAQLAATVCNASGNYKSARQTKDFLLLKDHANPSGLSEAAQQFLKESALGKRR